MSVIVGCNRGKRTESHGMFIIKKDIRVIILFQTLNDEISKDEKIVLLISKTVLSK